MLKSALQDRKQFSVRYGEANAATYDPLKSKVVAGLARAVTDADLTQVQRQQKWGEFSMEMILTPDILTGLNGEQVGIYVLNDR